MSKKKEIKENNSDPDFLIKGIGRSAQNDKNVISNSDEWLVKNFEQAVNKHELTWKMFEGGTHHTIYSKSQKKEFKAHYYTDPVIGIKLYLDPKTSRSKHRAIYQLTSNHTLDFVQYLSH